MQNHQIPAANPEMICPNRMLIPILVLSSHSLQVSVYCTSRPFYHLEGFSQNIKNMGISSGILTLQGCGSLLIVNALRILILDLDIKNVNASWI
jgi:hypothetical protein